MRLKSFRVQNYRSIIDSGDINIDQLTDADQLTNAGQLTALIGRNESGKSNLLRALYSLNPSDGSEVLNKEKDFSLHCKAEEYTDTAPTISTLWELNDEDKKAIGDLWEQGKTATAVRVDRYYDAPLVFDFEGEALEEFDFAAIKSNINKLASALKKDAAKFNEVSREQIEGMVDTFEANIASLYEASDDGESEAELAIETLQLDLASVDTQFTEDQKPRIAELKKLEEKIYGDKDSLNEAYQWVANHLPIFMYLEEYPELNGYQNIAEFLRQQEQGSLTPSGKNFEKMCKVAGLEPKELQDLHREDRSVKRNNLANQASEKITNEIRRLWKNESLDINFKLDGEHINTFVSVPNAAGSKVEINLNERSRGFKWFFSFYVTFAADTKGGEAENAILLLDEPGLHLHAKAQRNLLNHLENGFENQQILYTTHSPFMVPMHRLDIVRTVNAKNGKTTVSNDLYGDADTLFPLQAALGYDLSQSLSIGPNNLVVEGHTDFRLLSSISFHLNGNGREGLNDKIVITSVGGAQKIPYMVNFLVSENLNVVVLFDYESGTKTTQEKLVKSKAIKENKIVFISAAFGASPRKKADIEDLLDPKIYEMLVRKSYEKELKGVSLKLNKDIPRIAKRFESAFKEAKLKFNKTRPMWLLLEKMGTSPDEIVTDEVAKRFETLFKIINSRFFPKG